MDDEQQRDQDALYRGIGRFLVSFSQLTAHMESGIVSMAGIGRGQAAINAWQLGLSGIEARRLQTLFFGVAATSIELTAEEQRIHKELSKAVDKFIPLRNRFAHGGWYLGTFTSESDEPSYKEAFLAHSQPHPVTGLVMKNERYTGQQLEAVCDEIDELRGLLWELASGCKSSGGHLPRVGDRLEMVDGKVRRRNLDGWEPPADTIS